MIATYDGPRDGTKKKVSGEMPATYQPLYVEAAWQEYWEASGFYTCDPAKAMVSVSSCLRVRVSALTLVVFVDSGCLVAGLL